MNRIARLRHRLNSRHTPRFVSIRSSPLFAVPYLVHIRKDRDHVTYLTDRETARRLYNLLSGDGKHDVVTLVEE